MTHDDNLASREAEITSALAKVKDEIDEIGSLLPQIAEARRRFARTKSDEDFTAMTDIQGRALAIRDSIDRRLQDIQQASGIPEEVWDALSAVEPEKNGENRLLRDELAEQHVATTGIIDDDLPEALDNLRSLLPRGWLEEESGNFHRLDVLAQDSQPLSIVKGLRPESEAPGIHRFRQALRVTADYMTTNPAYDHFAGASLVPQTVQLGRRLRSLRSVGGDVSARLESLWRHAGDSTDSTAFELLVAAACAERGRSVEFIRETGEASPDLRCHDPYPLVIECKRKRPLSEYELREEGLMRPIYKQLQLLAEKHGLTGRFDLNLFVEADKVSPQEVAARLVSQRLAAHPDRVLKYEWGAVAFHELPHRVTLPGITRLYSPFMLEAVFDWNSDLPRWDGILCSVRCNRELTMDVVRAPLALVWTNSSHAAIHRRSWSPLDLYGDAMRQIPPGEFGIVYLSYHEGTRSEIANSRTHRYLDRIKEWEHSGLIRVPISFLVRVYPRPLQHGNPDLIENTVQFWEKESGDPALFKDFPSCIFTK